jgi:hypothetical protein
LFQNRHQLVLRGRVRDGRPGARAVSREHAAHSEVRHDDVRNDLPVRPLIRCRTISVMRRSETSTASNRHCSCGGIPSSDDRVSFTSPRPKPWDRRDDQGKRILTALCREGCRRLTPSAQSAFRRGWRDRSRNTPIWLGGIPDSRRVARTLALRLAVADAASRCLMARVKIVLVAADEVKSAM